MHLGSVLLLIFFSVGTKAVEIEEQDTVLVLTDDLFQRAIDENPFLLVKFYAPWCGNSKELAPGFANASKILRAKESNVKLAKMDATTNKRTADRYGIKHFPTVKLFRLYGDEFSLKHSLPTEYKGKETPEAIVDWVEKMSTSPLRKLETLKEVKEFVQKHDIAIVGLFKDQRSWAVDNFVAAAEQLDGFGYEFGITSDNAVFEAYDISNDELVLFKKFEEGRNDFKGKRGWGVDQIKNFAISNSLPLVVEYDPKLALRISENENSALYLITSSRSEEFVAHKDLMNRIAQDNKGKLIPVLVDIESKGTEELLENLGVEKAEIPTARFFKNENEIFMYQDDEISESKISVFMNDAKRGRIKPMTHTKSEELPTNWDSGNVKILVGKNFQDVVDSSKKVFAFFYSPEISACLDLEPLWEQLGEDFKGREDLLIARIDMSNNEVPSVDVPTIPSMILFHRSHKSFGRFNDEPNLQNLRNWLSSQGIFIKRGRDEL